MPGAAAPSPHLQLAPRPKLQAGTSWHPPNPPAPGFLALPVAPQWPPHGCQGLWPKARRRPVHTLPTRPEINILPGNGTCSLSVYSPRPSRAGEAPAMRAACLSPQQLCNSQCPPLSELPLRACWSWGNKGFTSQDLPTAAPLHALFTSLAHLLGSVSSGSKCSPNPRTGSHAGRT